MTGFRYYLLLYCFCFLFSGVHAQENARIYGVVTDEENQPLPGAAYQILDGPGGITDAWGRFEVAVMNSDSVILFVRYLGYERWMGSIALTEKMPLAIQLTPSFFALQTVELLGTWADASAPFTNSQLNVEAIEPLNLGQDIPYLLRFTPGVVATSDAGTGIGYTGIRVRGSDPTRTNITINGVPINDPESQAVFWVNMPDIISSVDRVQIQRGAGTSTNGAGAFGATINLQTQTLRSLPYGELAAGIGSFNTQRTTIQAGTGLLRGHWTIDGRYSAIQSDGYIDRAKANLQSGYAALTWQDDQTMVRLLGFRGRERTYQSWWGTPESRINNDLNAMLAHATNNGFTEAQTQNLLMAGRTYNYYTYRDEVDQYGQDNVQLQVSRALNARWRINTTAHYTHGAGYFEQYRIQDTRAAYGLGPVVTGKDTIETTDLVRRRWLANDFAGFVGNIRYEAKRWNLHIGGAWNSYFGNHFGRIIWAEFAKGIQPDHEYYRGDATKTDGNLFVKADGDIATQLRWFADLQVRHVGYRTRGTDTDLRTYDVKDELTFFNPKAGLTWSPSREIECYGSVAVAQREPSRSDYVDAPQGAHPQPERLVDFELGSRLSLRNWQLAANGYWMDYTDQLVPTGALNDVGATLKVNVPDSYRVGIEIQADGDLGIGFRYQGSLGLSQNRIRQFEEVIYDYTTGFDEIRIQHKDVDIAYSPAFVYSHQVGWSGWNGLGITWMSQYIGEQFLDNTSNHARAIDPWWVQDIQVYWGKQIRNVGELKVRFQVNNVLDQSYSSNGYTYSYVYGDVVTENFYYPQAGRNWLAGISLSW